MTEAVLSVRDLCVDYATAKGAVRAVDRFSLDIQRNEIVGLVGESGCGKTTAAFAIARLNRLPAFTAGGDIRLSGLPWSKLSEKQLQPYRWKKMSMVFQSAINALNPVITIGEQFYDTLLAGGVSKKRVRERAAELLSLVSISPDKLNSYSHQLSGGQRQRMCIALAMAFNPELIIMDEPTTALDVVMQRDIIREIIDIKNRFSLSILFISQDLNLVSSISDRTVIMYDGQIVETGSTQQVFSNPQHPYTQGLIASTLSLHTAVDNLTGIPGEIPSLAQLPEGCRFMGRCGISQDVCAQPVALQTKVDNRRVRCIQV
jgi:peptide/nickel transport system ATP-binding protein